MRVSRGLLAAVLLAAAGVSPLACGDEDARNAPQRAVTLALDFQPNAAHAGIYGAVRTGSDRRRGLRLRIRTPSASTDSLKLLAAGRAQFAIVDIHDLGLARRRGQEIVGVGAIVQRPLAAVIADRSVARPRELEGRRVGVTGLPSDEAVLRAVMRSDGGDFAETRPTTIGFSAVPALVGGRVDAVVGFWNAEGVVLRERAVPTREFRLNELEAARYPELVLVTRRETLARDRPLVRDLVAALAKGTRAALADREATVRQLADASGADRRLVAAQLRAVAPALTPPLRLDRGALRSWARFDERFGILDRRPDVEEAFALGLR